MAAQGQMSGLHLQQGTTAQQQAHTLMSHTSKSNKVGKQTHINMCEER